MQRQKSFNQTQPTLYLVATPIGNLDELTPRAIHILESVDLIAAEDTRNTVKLLNHFEIQTKMMSHHEHNIKQSIPKIISLIKEGNSIALVSDAGYPAVSDPGYELVQAAIQEEIPVVPISGANAGLDALIVSGIAPQPFLFYGFLSHQDSTKKKELEQLKTQSPTLIFYEAPHRIEKTLKIMLSILGNRNIALCRELTKKHEEIIRGTIEEILEIAAELKGEMVLIVEGAKEVITEKPSLDQILEVMKDYLQNGLKTKEAARQTANDLNLKKNEVYQLYINQSEND